MILIADSGSTKTDWALAGNNGHMDYFSTTGVNPMIQKQEEINELFKKELSPYLQNNKIIKIYFYGAGCSTSDTISKVKKAFNEVCTDAVAEVEHDLLGAARAIFGDEKGIACILGTGSNSTYYDGKDVVQRVPSLGFILGDEGSGAYMGKLLIRDYFYKKLPESLNNKFRDEFGYLSRDEVFANVYQNPNPNRYLASFAKFISNHHTHEEYLQQIIITAFTDFFEQHLTHYLDKKDEKLGMVGSIAWNFVKQLERVAEKYHFHLYKIIQSPLKDLVNYHIEKNKL